MSVIGSTEIKIIVTIVLSSILLYSIWELLNKSCVIYLTGESFTVSNCQINQNLVNLVREQREILSCRL
uniref:Movement protein TGBp3 n=1 Tax=Cowpea mild mottle virus TaxID=67761 RepID=U5TZC7_9VIRU|nr:triple gene block 3 [Cowpea mild mottle virus]AGZ15259.1 triple gene block 3 [Cowpea mild mottle virus]AGZ15269.1 triple gene block 3 [Cowpea mild mottle virus]WHF58456.1 triple gene block 3 protein [Cowpea mild mottle virus]